MADDLKLGLLPTNTSNVCIYSPMETSSPVKRDKLSSQSSKEKKKVKMVRKEKGKMRRKQESEEFLIPLLIILNPLTHILDQENLRLWMHVKECLQDVRYCQL